MSSGFPGYGQFLNSVPLPNGWEIRYSEIGRPYFIDHINKRSTYDDPRIPFLQSYGYPSQPGLMQYPSQTFDQVSSSIGPTSPLPNGWEMRYSETGRPYFIDHINKRSTYDDPRINLSQLANPSMTSNPISNVQPVYYQNNQNFSVKPPFVQPTSGTINPQQQTSPSFPNSQLPLISPSYNQQMKAVQISPFDQNQVTQNHQVLSYNQNSSIPLSVNPQSPNPQVYLQQQPLENSQSNQKIIGQSQQQLSKIPEMNGCRTSTEISPSLSNMQQQSLNSNSSNKRLSSVPPSFEESMSNSNFISQTQYAEYLGYPNLEDPLPEGWEIKKDPSGKPYYIDKINKRTTYQDPRKSLSLNLPNQNPPNQNPPNQNPTNQNPTNQNPTNQNSTNQNPPVNQNFSQKQLTNHTSRPSMSVEIKNIIKEGWVTKQGGGFKSWKKRYFILKLNGISYYEYPPSTTSQVLSISNFKGFISFSEDTEVFEEKGKTSFIIRVKGSKARDYKIHCVSNEEVKEWENAIKSVLNQIKSKSTTAFKIFGGSLSIIMEHQRSTGNNNPLPDFIKTIFEFLDTDEIYATEGIFRISGNLTFINEMKDTINSGKNFIIAPNTDPHAVAGLLKLFLRELEEPLISFEVFDKCVAIPLNEDPELYLNHLQEAMDSLPTDNKIFLKYLLRTLKCIILQNEINKMTSSNLAIVFAPSLFRKRDSDIQYFRSADLLKQMIDNCERITKNFP